jgi:hypothetical protein
MRVGAYDAAKKETENWWITTRIHVEVKFQCLHIASDANYLIAIHSVSKVVGINGKHM